MPKIIGKLQDSSEFESLIQDWLQKKLVNPKIKRFGIEGEKQFGIDIYGDDNICKEFFVAQVKNYNKNNKTTTDIKKDIIKHLEDFDLGSKDKEFSNIYFKTRTFYYISSCEKPSKIDSIIENISDERIRNKKCSVVGYFWSDIVKDVQNYKDLFTKYFSSQFIDDSKPRLEIEFNQCSNFNHKKLIFIKNESADNKSFYLKDNHYKSNKNHLTSDRTFNNIFTSHHKIQGITSFVISESQWHQEKEEISFNKFIETEIKNGVKIKLRVKNTGNAPANNLRVVLKIPSSKLIWEDYRGMHRIPHPSQKEFISIDHELNKVEFFYKGSLQHHHDYEFEEIYILFESLENIKFEVEIVSDETNVITREYDPSIKNKDIIVEVNSKCYELYNKYKSKFLKKEL